MNVMNAVLIILLILIISLAAAAAAKKMRRGGGCCGEHEEAEKKVTKLQAMLAEFIIKPLQFQNEIRWLESLLEIARNRDQLTYERQLNLLTGMKCKPYLIQNFTKTKETMMS